MTPTVHNERRAGAEAARPSERPPTVMQHAAATPAGRHRIAGLARAAGRRLADRIHSAADDQARVLGWEVTETPGPLGLRGRSYRDPRFATLRNRQGAAAGRDGRHD